MSVRTPPKSSKNSPLKGLQSRPGSSEPIRPRLKIFRVLWVGRIASLARALEDARPRERMWRCVGEAFEADRARIVFCDLRTVGCLVSVFRRKFAKSPFLEFVDFRVSLQQSRQAIDVLEVRALSWLHPARSRLILNRYSKLYSNVAG